MSHSKTIRHAVLLGTFSLIGAMQAGSMEMSAGRAAACSDTAVSADFHLVDAQLATLLARMIKDNPRLQAARSNCEAAFEMVPQAKALPDPQLNYRFFAATPETRVGPQRQGLDLMQELPWRGKLSLQAQRASRAAEAATWSIAALEKQLVAELKRAYFGAAFLQRSLEINEAERDLLRRFEQSALSRFKTGGGTQQDVVKLQTDINRLEDRRVVLTQQLMTIEEKIARLLGSSEKLVLEQIGIELPPEVDLGDEFSPSAHPSLKAKQKQIDAAAASVERQKLERRPNFRLGLHYTQVDDRDDAQGILNPPSGNGEDIIGLAIGINLPVRRKRIAAGVAQAEATRSARQKELRAEQDSLRFELRSARIAVDALRERATLYSQILIPQAEHALASAETAYITDRLDVLNLLDSQRVLLELRLSHARLVVDQWIALADTELALGSKFPEGGWTP